MEAQKVSDLLELQFGCEPWQANLFASLDAVLDYWDMPIAGILVDRGTSFLFANILGVNGEAGMWAYRRLEEHQTKELRQAGGQTELRSLIDALLVHEPILVAASSDDRLVVWAQIAPAEDMNTLTHGAFSVLEDEIEKVKRATTAWEEQSSSLSRSG